MPINPCIVDSNCIDLSIDANSNLRADLIISPAVGNCAECTAAGLFVDCAAVSPNACNAITSLANGLWSLEVVQGFAEIGPASGAPYNDLTVAGPLVPAGTVVARSGTFTFNTPASCGDGILLTSQMVGPVQIVDISAGGRAITGFQSRVVPNPFAGGPYALYENSGAALGEIAFPNNNPTPYVSTVGAGAAVTIAWEQTYEITAGTVGSIIFRSIFMYAWWVFA